MARTARLRGARRKSYRRPVNVEREGHLKVKPKASCRAHGNRENGIARINNVARPKLKRCTHRHRPTIAGAHSPENAGGCDSASRAGIFTAGVAGFVVLSPAIIWLARNVCLPDFRARFALLDALRHSREHCAAPVAPSSLLARLGLLGR